MKVSLAQAHLAEVAAAAAKSIQSCREAAFCGLGPSPGDVERQVED